MFPTSPTLTTTLLLACITPSLSPATSSGTAPLPPPPVVHATLSITHVGYDYYRVAVAGQSTVGNAAFTVRIYGDDFWFDDHLHTMVVNGPALTGSGGFFDRDVVVYRTMLDEDWEGADEIYAIVEVAGGGSDRTNTISRWF